MSLSEVLEQLPVGLDPSRRGLCDRPLPRASASPLPVSPLQLPAQRSFGSHFRCLDIGLCLLHWRINRLLSRELSSWTSTLAPLPAHSQGTSPLASCFVVTLRTLRPLASSVPSSVVSECLQVPNVWWLSREGSLSPSSCESPRGQRGGPWSSRPSVWLVLSAEGLPMVVMGRAFLSDRTGL